MALALSSPFFAPTLTKGKISCQPRFASRARSPASKAKEMAVQKRISSIKLLYMAVGFEPGRKIGKTTSLFRRVSSSISMILAEYDIRRKCLGQNRRKVDIKPNIPDEYRMGYSSNSASIASDTRRIRRVSPVILGEFALAIFLLFCEFSLSIYDEFDEYRKTYTTNSASIKGILDEFDVYDSPYSPNFT
ncbi:hypothetical protein KSP39_PZI007815 [Platanthera zijinensis]|uniref:Uncharacterized protein n=1 Tax=Platanthera zijinensis TaxID=2320716 RepID=A0AAP0BMU9_9ASPA